MGLEEKAEKGILRKKSFIVSDLFNKWDEAGQTIFFNSPFKYIIYSNTPVVNVLVSRVSHSVGLSVPASAPKDLSTWWLLASKNNMIPACLHLF